MYNGCQFYYLFCMYKRIENDSQLLKSQFLEPMPSPGGRCPEGADEGITKLKSLWVSTVVVLPSSVTYGDSFSQEKPIDKSEFNSYPEKTMRILFDSQKTEYKTPFGCVTPTQPMTLCIHVPVSVGAKTVEICLEAESVENYVNHKFSKTATQGLYEKWECTFAIEDEGLYFYHFYITKKDGGFHLFKAEDGTNMEEGEKWQISCVPNDFSVPDWAKGAVIYQIFPDRFHKAGACDLAGKLPPYTLRTTRA